jgi:hypothetical protein
MFGWISVFEIGVHNLNQSQIHRVILHRSGWNPMPRDLTQS